VREKSENTIRNLKRYYGLLLGELDRIKSPPKRVRRLKRDRQLFESQAPDRSKRTKFIEESLPHLAYVIGMYDPSWDPAQAPPIRPRGKRFLPHGAIAEAAMDILREEAGNIFITIAEIVDRIGQQYSIDLSTVEARQKYHTAVNNALMKTYRKFLVCNEAQPTGWAIRQEPEEHD
jgi:hypothetical protein